jgi:hypothetical protein
MSKNSKKSIGWSTVLILFGLVTLFGGAKWLVLLIPAAMLIWYSAGPMFGSGRN